MKNNKKNTESKSKRPETVAEKGATMHPFYLPAHIRCDNGEFISSSNREELLQNDAARQAPSLTLVIFEVNFDSQVVSLVLRRFLTQLKIRTAIKRAHLANRKRQRELRRGARSGKLRPIMIDKLGYVPAYRPDLKGTIESQFGSLKRYLEGTLQSTQAPTGDTK